MALTDGENGTGMVMPVGPIGYGGGNYGGGYGGFGYGIPFFPMMGGYGGGFGGWGGDSGWFILLLILAMGNSGWGGFGGFGGFGGGLGIDFPWLLNGQNQINANTDAAVNQLSTQSALGNLSTAVTSGFGDVQLGIAGVNQNICQTGNNTVAAVTGAQNALAQQLYTNEIASLNRSFDEQTANVAGFNGVQSKLADCCCENRLATQGVQNTIIQDGSATRQAIAQGIQSIQDKLCQLELDGVRSDLNAAQRENATLQNQLNMAAFRADNVAQTSRLLTDNAAQTQQIENYVRPQINPAYIVPNPYAYNFNPVGGWGGCGYGNGFGYNNGFGNVGFGNGTF